MKRRISYLQLSLMCGVCHIFEEGSLHKFSIAETCYVVYCSIRNLNSIGLVLPVKFARATSISDQRLSADNLILLIICVL